MTSQSEPRRAIGSDALSVRLQAALAGEYSIECELGRGGMGVVYLAREVRLTREVAIKILLPEVAEQAGMREQFVREAQTAARLSHPNIVAIHRVDEADGIVYFVMAYIAGETLAHRVATRGALPPHQAARVLRDVAWALTYAHASGIVHRDIKADNILIEQSTGRAVVTDFGIAGVTNAVARTDNGQIVGSPHYASPEQISGQPLDAMSDLYSLGVVGYLSLTGRLPFDAQTPQDVLMMHLNARPAAIATLAPAVPPRLTQVIERCLAKRPEHRFPSATAFADALDQAVDPPREIPAPLRVWLARTNRNPRAELIAGAFLTLTIGVPLATEGGNPWAGLAVSLASIVGLGILPSVARMRRVVKAGYEIDDVRVAVREFWMRRREEVMYELQERPRAFGPHGLRYLFGASALGAVAFWALANEGRVFPLVAAITCGAAAVGSGLLAIADSQRAWRIHSIGGAQLKFYGGKWGERLVRVAGWGVKNKGKASSLPQLTEVALGRATDALYNALPKALRKQLKSLPNTVRRLEVDAQKLRTQIDHLDESMVSLQGDAGSDARDRLLADLRLTRERGSDRLSATVAALENIRLDLMRLQLGDGHIQSVTASLESAQQVAADLGAYVDAAREVEDLLGAGPSPAADPA